MPQESASGVLSFPAFVVVMAHVAIRALAGRKRRLTSAEIEEATMPRPSDAMALYHTQEEIAS
jgi:microsomal dipeptidase-like Zn-dependent dipeptidase